MEFQEALEKKYMASFMSVRDHALALGMDTERLRCYIKGKRIPNIREKVDLYSHFKMWEYGLDWPRRVT